MAIRRGGWRFFPQAKVAVRGSPRAARGRAASSTASRTALACRCPRGRPRPMGTSGPKFSRCWTPSTSARANGADPVNASRCWRWIKGMTPKTSVVVSADAGSGPRFPTGDGRAANRGGGRSNRTSLAPKPSEHLPGFSGSIAAWSCAGSASPHASTRFLPWP